MSTDLQTGTTPRTNLLLKQVAWFNRMRFVAVVSMTLLSSVGSALEIVEGVLPFYVLAGIYFGVLFLGRGLGIAVGVHACYDLLVLVVMPGFAVSG